MRTNAEKGIVTARGASAGRLVRQSGITGSCWESLAATTISPERKKRMTENTVIPVALVIILFLWEGFRFGDIACSILLVVELCCILPSFALLPLRQISLGQACRIYTWFLFASAVAAYVDYEVMLTHGMWFSDRMQDDPGKYFLMAQSAFQYVRINDPGFVLLIQYIWKIFLLFGEPSYLSLVNAVIILSSVFAVCCMEVTRYIIPSARVLPYLFVFNPIVIMLNASLMRDIFLGAVGWAAVLCGIPFLTRETHSLFKGFWLGIGFIAGCVVVYFMRTVSGAFFVGVAIIIAVSRFQKLNKTYTVIVIICTLLFGGVIIQNMLQRSISHVQSSDKVIENARFSGSVGSLFQDNLAGRIAITLGATAVYGMPFWRISSPMQVDGVLFNCGSLFAQLFTALPFLVGLLLLLRRPSLLGGVLLVIYFGWVVASSIMLQNHIRYIASHLLPVIAAIGSCGWNYLKMRVRSTRRLYYCLLFAAFFVIQVMIEIKKAQL